MNAFYVVIIPQLRAYVRAGTVHGYCYTLDNARRFATRGAANRFIASMRDGKSYKVRFVSK